MKVELEKEQLEGLYQIVARSQFSGNDAEFVAGLKQVLVSAIKESSLPVEGVKTKTK